MRAITVRTLVGSDAAAFKEVRLRALADHPEAYASSVEDEQDTPIKRIAKRIENYTDEESSLGAFIDERLVGLLYFHRHEHQKTRHKAHLGAMYTVPEERGKGIARALLDEAIARARALDGLEELVLAVTVGNDVARNLYLSVGFEPYAVESRYLKIGDQYYDIEWMILRL